MIVVRGWRRINDWLHGVRCVACGRRSVHWRRKAIDDALAQEWDLDSHWRALFDDREGCGCRLCGCSRRSQQMAAVIAAEVGCRVGERPFQTLADAVASVGFRSLKIAEINSCGALHAFWRHHPRLAYSEFGSRVAGVPHEDLMSLTYADQSFDLVFTSETLEHVPDTSKALSEIRRVLVPGGAHIFTVPLVPDRQSRQRAEMSGSEVHHLLPPSFHGRPGTSLPDRLVFHEFGGDFVELLSRSGFGVRQVEDPTNAAMRTFVAVRSD